VMTLLRGGHVGQASAGPAGGGSPGRVGSRLPRPTLGVPQLRPRTRGANRPRPASSAASGGRAETATEPAEWYKCARDERHLDRMTEQGGPPWAPPRFCRVRKDEPNEYWG
jgi:hypothetical protein